MTPQPSMKRGRQSLNQVSTKLGEGQRDVLGGGDWPLLDEHRTMSPAATVTVRVNTAALVPQWHDRGRPFANRAFRPGETSP